MEEDCSSEEGGRKFSCLVKELQQEGADGEDVRKASVGADMGLQLVLDQHSNLDSLQTLHEPGQGLKVLIGQPSAFPLLGQESLLLAPGQSHHLQLAATVITSTDAVASLHPEDRECLFPSERSLQHHTSYSQARPLSNLSQNFFLQASCQFECGLANASRTLGNWLDWQKIQKFQVS